MFFSITRTFFSHRRTKQLLKHNAISIKLNSPDFNTLKFLIEEYTRLDFSDFLSTLLAIFHVINKKFQPARLLTYLVKKQAGWNFFPTLLVYSGLLFYQGLQSMKSSINKADKFKGSDNFATLSVCHYPSLFFPDFNSRGLPRYLIMPIQQSISIL